jgi:hypothetical protein
MIRFLKFALLQALLLAQSNTALDERIANAPLTREERQEVTAALSQKNFERLEAVLSKDSALLGALEFVNGRMTQAVRAFRHADSLRPLDDHARVARRVDAA